jgi:hypothetical protein
MRYSTTTVAGVREYDHRRIWEKAFGPIPSGMQIDHINGNIQDNSLENLRLVDRLENSRNSKKYATNTSGLMGVTFQKQSGKWLSRINVKGKSIHLGISTDWFEAVCARKSGENQYGFHVNHGRIV